MKYFIPLCLSVLLYSCAAPIQNLTKTQYVNPNFGLEQISEGGLALLPITAIQGHERYRRQLGEYLNQNLKYVVPNGIVLTWQETDDLLNKFSKINTYEDLIKSYKETSIINRDRVKELKEALNVRYILYCLIQNFSESQENNYNSTSGWKTIKKGNVEVFCLIIDIESGYIVQEITGQILSTDEDYSYYNDNYEEYIRLTASSVLSQIPGVKIPY